MENSGSEHRLVCPRQPSQDLVLQEIAHADRVFATASLQ